MLWLAVFFKSKVEISGLGFGVWQGWGGGEVAEYAERASGFQKSEVFDGETDLSTRPPEE